jgi:squalene cyclase
MRQWLIVIALAGTPDVPVEAQLEPVRVDDATGVVIESSLRYLASRQSDEGSWSAWGNHRAALTAYTLHAFMAAGHLPDDGPHGATLRRALDFLVSCARPDGYIAASSGDHNMYGHGIATIVLGELYGQVRDDRLRPILERSVAVIVASQHESGGWRYQPQPVDADISVTVLQLVALRSARSAGIDVPQQVIDRAIEYVRSCRHEESGGFTYQGHGEPGFARTAAAVYSLQVSGLFDDPMIDAAVAYLESNFDTQLQWFTYGHFYAAPAMYLRGGQTWEGWYRRIHSMLMSRVNVEGDLAWWSPMDEGGGGVNDEYATAVYVSILSVPLAGVPLYQR